MVRLKRKRKIGILFFILLVEISTHAVFIIYFNTFFPLSNFEYGTVSRYNLRRVEQSFCPVFL